MIAFLKAVSNLHQNITLEMVIEAMIKVVVANVLYLNILNIMTTIFSISSAMAKEVFTIDAPDLKSRGYGYWLSIVLSAIWLALHTGSDRLQLFDVMDSIQPVYKTIPAHDISTLCDVCTCRRSGDRA
ncbi:hypothetical protein NIA73_14005 [Anaerobutyricum hallii]|nr:hypothetical protein [Anaerobutyricum hallii]